MENNIIYVDRESGGRLTGKSLWPRSRRQWSFCRRTRRRSATGAACPFSSLPLWKLSSGSTIAKADWKLQSYRKETPSNVEMTKYHIGNCNLMALDLPM